MLATAESWNDRFGPFFCKMYFLYASGSRKKKLADFFWVLPPQKSIFLWKGVAGWPDFQNWGHALIFGKLHHKEIALVFGRGAWLTSFPKLRASPQFWKSAEYEVLCRWPSSTIMNRLREHTVEMMGQREGQKVEKWPFRLDLNFCESREEREDDEKFYRRQTFLFF